MKNPNSLLLLIITIMITCSTKPSFSQGQKFIYAEAAGSGLLASINFDRRFQKDSREGMGFKAGIGTGSLLGLWDSKFNIPLGLNYVKGKNKSAFLFGANLTTTLVDENAYEKSGVILVPSLDIGYRFRPLKKGFAFQATINPCYVQDSGLSLIGGVGLGYAW